ncbi:MAG TPA: glycosyltransferase family 2 protein [Thermoanaerobaculia bacterium]|nr:glycosyltransferase family 2 protein [Thermoanaerobaculia bacterium]
MERSVVAILITYNSERYLERCLEGLRSQSLQPREIVVIDNASEDDSVAIVERALPSARVIHNRTNTGFSAAVNQGVALTESDYVLLVNPDLYLTSHYLRLVVEATEIAGDDYGAATGKLLRGSGPSIAPNGLVDSKGIRMTRSGRHLDIAGGEPDSDGGELVTEVFGVSGAGALYRRRFLADVAIGGEIFDESFFAYREDADLAWRGRLFGWSALYVPQAVGHHVRQVTPEVRRKLPPSLNYHSVKNRFLLRLKNQGVFLAMRNAPFEMWRDVMILVATLTVERTSLPAWRWLWQHRSEIAQKRRVIQKRRKVNDRELSRWFSGS